MGTRQMKEVSLAPAAPATAALNLKLRTDAGGTDVTLSGPTQACLTLRSTFNNGQLQSMWSDLNQQLTEFKDTLGHDLKVKPSALWKAAEILNGVGLDLASAIFGSKWGAVVDYFRRSFVIARNAMVDLDMTMSQTLPLELLPVFDSGEMPCTDNSVDDIAAISRIFDRFLGFSTSIRRIFSTQEFDQQNALATLLPPKVCVFRHYGLDKEGSETEVLDQSPDLLSVTETWPGKQLPLDAEAEFCHRFYDQNCRFDIHHFSCHYQTNDQKPLDSWLTLGDPDGHSIEIKLRAIGRRFSEFEQRSASRRAPTSPMPLVLFNACGATRIDPAAAATLPGFMLNGRCRAFIGPETKVPDVPASAFASYFYWALMDRATVAQALWRARQNLLWNDWNPVGILYTLYGNPDLVLTEASLEG
jgi:hypothetical protein